MANFQKAPKAYSFALLLLIFGFNSGLIGSLYVEALDYLYHDTSQTTAHSSLSNDGNVCICVPPRSCPGLDDGSGILSERIMQDNSHSVEESSRIVYNTVTPVSPTVAYTGLSTAFPYSGGCFYGLIRCCRPGRYRCGERYPPPPRSPKTLPGQAPYGSYPWMAALLSRRGEHYVGGGALIDYKHVITAAHKVNNVHAEFLKVRLGDWNSSNGHSPIPAREHNALKIIIHPNFTIPNLYNDIAVIVLTTPVSLGVTPTIGTVCLSRDHNYNSNCFISGWGKNSWTGPYSTVQRQVHVTIRTPNVCQDQLRKTKLGPSFNFNSYNFICAGGEAGKDACTGDGGSPLVCEMGGRWAVIGLVSWGIGCGTSNVPGVYINIPSYLPWIEYVIKTM